MASLRLSPVVPSKKAVEIDPNPRGSGSNPTSRSGGTNRRQRPKPRIARERFFLKDGQSDVRRGSLYWEKRGIGRSSSIEKDRQKVKGICPRFRLCKIMIKRAPVSAYGQLMTDSDYFQRLEALFHELEGLPPEARLARLEVLADEDPLLHAELVKMLDPSEQRARGERALDSVAGRGGMAASIDELTDGQPSDPEQVGPYRLVRKIGEGGMGRVYLAEQTEPVRRRVALKLTRRGLDSQEALVRFRAERQALAVLEHPNIARVFDAGSMQDGRPWFAMEYIEGVSITDWAAAHQLGLVERIQLLLPVCEAVQHAHRKGLIHRDLKPSNILTVDQNGQPVPKVIDFGIARVLVGDADDRTQVTRLGELIGTPEYMSPEQAALGEIDIDTRSDVYSLGLVLYELLVGALPTTGAELRALGFEAMCRHIREGETPRPSRARLAPETIGDATTQRWQARLRGDLDSVLLKALAKDRDRRYGSAADLADDLRRYLASEPVVAQPPSRRYRAGKFIRRNRTLVGATLIVAVSMVAATAISAIGFVEARQAEQRAQKAAEQAVLEAERANAAQLEAESQYELANAFLLGQRVYSELLLDQFAGEDGGQELTETLMERWREQHANWRDSEDTATALSLALGRNFYFRQDYISTHEIFEGWLEAGYGSEAMRAAGRELYASSLFDAGRRDEAVPVLRDVLATMESGMKRSAVDRFNVAIRIATQSRDPDDLSRAEALYRQRDKEFGVSSPSALQRIENLGGLMTIRRLQGDLAGSAEVLEDMLQVYVDHPDLSFGRSIVHTRLAELWLFDQDRSEDAEVLARRVMTKDVELLGEGLVTARGAYLLARSLLHQGRFGEAREALDEAAAIHARHAGATAQPIEYRLARLLLSVESGSNAEADQHLAALRDEVSAMPVASTWSETLALAELYAKAKMNPESLPELGDQLPARPAIDLEAIYLHTRLLELVTDPAHDTGRQ